MDVKIFSKKVVTIVLAIIMVMSPLAYATESKYSSNREILYKQMRGMGKSEVNRLVKDAAKKLNKNEEEVIKQILSEISNNTDDYSSKDSKSSKAKSYRKFILRKPKYYGDIFYEPASTSGFAHGHVGIYYTSNILVESIKKGVRKIRRYDKRVGVGSKVFTISNVSVSKSNEASNWAYGRIGESYSYNFATNRLTSYYGAKNCSKLVWSAYMVKAGVDIDRNKGLGVYPNDILYYRYSRVYKTYR